LGDEKRKSDKKGRKSEDFITVQVTFPKRSSDDARLKITSYFWKL